MDKKKPPSPPTITSKEQLKALLADFMPSAEGSDATFVANENEKGDVNFAVSPGTRSHNRKLLIDGFTLVRDRIRYNAELNREVVALAVDVDSTHFWVDDFIHDKLNGKRKGDKICWEINGEAICLDPFTGELQ